MSDGAPAYAGLSMFIHKLPVVLRAERSVKNLVARAQRAGLRSVWIKVAVGQRPYTTNIQRLDAVARALREARIGVVGWHEPRCATTEVAVLEANLVANLAAQWSLAAVVMDAEQPEGQFYFQGGPAEASAYAGRLRTRLDALGTPLGLCSHDIPANFPKFPFAAFVKHAHFVAPQVYYGGSPSVADRLDRAVKANAALTIPFIPIGAAWVGDVGGCKSASACAERALTFLHLVESHGFEGAGFWHWAGAPAAVWDVLFERADAGPSRRLILSPQHANRKRPARGGSRGTAGDPGSQPAGRSISGPNERPPRRVS